MAHGTNRGELAIGGLDAMPDVVARLETRRWPRVADLGCGRGEVALAIAAEFWDVLIEGFDSDDECLAEARRRATEAGLDARVRFHEGGAERLAEQGRYQLLLALDPGVPLDALAGARAGIAEDGVVLMARERGESSEALREHATAVGFAGVEELPLEHRSLRLVRLSA
jgi:SAM-dependent methyltransferase